MPTVVRPSLALRELRDPDPRDVGDSVEAFVDWLGGPSCIFLSGDQPGPVRAVTTLLHGNEPSGSHAVRRFLAQGIVPRVPLLLCVLSVDAARAEPRFTHRALPGRRDLNRCFGPRSEASESDAELELAGALLRRLHAAAPECLVDLHNTSGRGPAYSVCTRADAAREALTALFAERMIRTDLTLGTLMEATDPSIPTVTIECGGAGEQAAHDRAFAGLCRYAQAKDVFVRPAGAPALPVLEHPLRVELASQARVVFANTPDASADVTLPLDVDRHNFGVMKAGKPIGWLGSRGLSALHVIGADCELPVGELFAMVDGQLVPAVDLEPLMVTTDVEVAHSDCLFYLLPLG